MCCRFCAKVEVHSFEGRVGMRLRDCILYALIYCNLPDLLHQNAGSAQFLSHARILLVHKHRGLLPSGECCRRWCGLFVLLHFDIHNENALISVHITNYAWFFACYALFTKSEFLFHRCLCLWYTTKKTELLLRFLFQ